MGMRFLKKHYRPVLFVSFLTLLLSPARLPAQRQPASAHVNLYFPQIADGQFEGGRWQTAITLVNANSVDVTANIILYDGNGGGLQVDFGSGLQSRHTVRVPATGSVTLSSRPSSLPLRSGWAWVDANAPLMGSASYRLWLGGARGSGDHSALEPARHRLCLVRQPRPGRRRGQPEQPRPARGGSPCAE
jgi:hypothetical protein